ncbi:MAG: hypothetical protein AAFW65_02005 [Pseudomonadota bacterium]
MSGYTPFDSLTATAAALAVILSALVSLIGSSARRRNVEMKVASVQDLCELTGITDPRALQDVFGPPDMGRVWRTVSLPDVMAARRPLGRLISDPVVDWACITVAALSFFSSYFLIELALLIAVIAQVGGWIAASRLPR